MYQPWGLSTTYLQSLDPVENEVVKFVPPKSN